MALLRVGARRGAARARLALRQYSAKSPLGVAFQGDNDDEADVRYRTQKNPIVPSVQNLPSRWLKMDAGQQDDVIAYLEDRMRGDWRVLSGDEKRAAWYIWFGPWGPRSEGPAKRDLASIYTYLAGTVGATVLGLSLYKYSTFDADREVPGVSAQDERA